MEEYKTQLVWLETKNLRPADWNYKVEVSEEQREKFRNSIEVDGSAGVLAVREFSEDGGEPVFEVIDGNHRLEELEKMGLTKIPCENFGEISIAKAVTIARRRNHEWFERDDVRYAEIFRDLVLPEYSIDDLDKFMPDTREQLESVEKFLDFDWDSFNATPPAEKKSDEGETLSFTLTEQESAWVTMELDRISAAFKVNESKALLYAICGSASRSTAELEKYYRERLEG